MYEFSLDASSVCLVFVYRSEGKVSPALVHGSAGNSAQESSGATGLCFYKPLSN